MAITLRYRSRFGTGRAVFEPSDDLAIVHRKVAGSLSLAYEDDIEVADQPSGPYTAFQSLHGRSIDQIGLKHGDMLFLRVPADQTQQSSPVLDGKNLGTRRDAPINAPHPNGAEEKRLNKSHIDTILEAQSGEIHRERTKLCKHGGKAMCEYCMPLQPYDATYLKEHKIKHASFHAYLKKINTQRNRPESGSTFVPPLQESSVRVASACITNHPPWPGGICSRCQPSAITLQRQEFRMVDHVEFADSVVIDNFLNFWRKSGLQRFGYMYGHYEVYDAVPLGQKAVVEAIFEPPQSSQADGIELLSWPEETSINELARKCHLEKLGLIFTDLTDDGSGTGLVVAKRHMDSFFLSGLEASLAAEHQVSHPYITQWSVSDKFSSKFITVAISGNAQGEIEVQSYQISEQGTAMFEAQVIEPSTDPNMILVVPESSKTYVPEIFYSDINEYGRQVKKSATPAFPIEYLLVNLTYGIPKEGNPLFKRGTFPIANRCVIGEVADLHAISKQLNLDASSQVEALSDFQLLLYIITLDILPPQDVALLVSAALTRDSDVAQQLVASSSWQTLLMIINETRGIPPSMKRIADG